jgi:hypothetical protein
LAASGGGRCGGDGHPAGGGVYQVPYQGVRRPPPQQAQELSQQAAATISQSFTGAEQVAKQFPQAQAEQLIAAAQQAFVDGKTAAILFAVIASLIGLVLVLFLYPNKQDEEATYARVAGRQPHPRRDARPEPEPDPGARAAEPDAPP